MEPDELMHLIALTRVPHIGDVHIRSLLQHFGGAQEVFKARRRQLECVPGIGRVRAASIRSKRDLTAAERELRFLEKHRIRALAYGTNDYPARLLDCCDAPALMFYRGEADLNAARVLSVVGTREPSDYGREWTARLMAELAPFAPLVVSGLAYGIDTVAHKKALRNGLSTVGILAHGLDRIYPHSNRAMAREMTERGGLLTEFMSGTPPDAQNFPRRNRIVAGICDAVVVVETGEKGGSLITVDIANSYNRDVLALPGRVTDPRSRGCNRLIREHRAQLVTEAKDIVEMLNWDLGKKAVGGRQRTLFAELNETEKEVLKEIGERGAMHTDEIRRLCGLRSAEAAACLLNLEMLGLVRSLPGAKYGSA
jgi:DNA processing protein